MQQQLLVHIWSQHAPLVPALGVMWQEVDKQTEKDEQDVTGNSPLELLRKAFSHMLWKKWINLELVFSWPWKIRVTGGESAAKLKCPRIMFFLLERIWPTSHHICIFPHLQIVFQIGLTSSYKSSIQSHLPVFFFGLSIVNWDIMDIVVPSEKCNYLPLTAINAIKHYTNWLK